MTFLPDKDKMPTECRTPKGERVSLSPKLEKGVTLPQYTHLS